MLSNEQAKAIANRQIAGIKPTEDEAAQIMALSREDVHKVASFLPKPPDLQLIAVDGRVVLVRNNRVIGLKRFNQIAADLHALADEVENATGDFADLAPAYDFTGEFDARIKALATADMVGQVLTAEWREETAAIVRALADAALEQEPEGPLLDVIGHVRRAPTSTSGFVFAEEATQ